MATRKEKFILSTFGVIIHIFLNIIFYILVVFAVITASRYVYNFSYQVFGSMPVAKIASTETEITINKGDSTMRVAELLDRKKLILNKYSFYVRGKLTGQNILPGTYKLNNGMDYNEIFEIITKTKDDKNGRT